jgi:hypothetical protein
MRNRHPEAFKNVVKAQTQMLSRNYVIPLKYVGPDAMHYLSERILAIEGVQAISPGKTVHEDGAYKILVHQKHHTAAREFLSQELSKWIDVEVAPDAKVTLQRYPHAPAVAQINSDSFSRGNDSYMTISVNTAMSVQSTISDSSPPTFVFRRDKDSDTSTLGGSRTNTSSQHSRTWAETVAERSTQATNNDLTSSEREPHSQIAEDLMRSRAEVEILKSRLAQMELDRAEQQFQLANTVQEQVQKAVQDQMAQFTLQMTQMFSSLVTTLHHPAGSQPKRQAQELEEDYTHTPQIETEAPVFTEPKRQDSKLTPSKRNAAMQEGATASELTPTSLLGARVNKPTLLKQGSNHPYNRAQSKTDEARASMSESEDEDSIQYHSGIESITKSSTSLMEVEAASMNHE